METNSRTFTCSAGTSRVLWGFFVVLAGILLFAFNTGALPMEYRRVVFSFPTLLVVFGTVKLICGRHRILSLILIAIGSYFLATKLGVMHASIAQATTPILLVLLGLGIMFHRHEYSRKKPTESTSCCGATYRLDENHIFGGNKKKYGNELFHGGEVNCVFGGAHLDLTEAYLAEGETKLDINCVFGGVALIVPESWTVRVEVSSLFGDFQDRRRGSSGFRDPDRILVITGSCVFGGGEIRYE